MGTDFNYTKVLDEVINNSMESTAEVSGDLATEGNALAMFLVFVFIMLLLIIVVAVAFGGIIRIMKPE